MNEETVGLHLADIADSPRYLPEQQWALGRVIQQGSIALHRLVEIGAIDRDWLVSGDDGRPRRMTLENLSWLKVEAKVENLAVEEQGRSEWEALAQAGKARQELAEGYTALVVDLATAYQGQGSPLSDLIQEGHVGLMIAVSKFDPERGYLFSTMATWWIEQAIRRALLGKTRTIYLPLDIAASVRRMWKVQAILTQELGGDNPSASEVAEKMGIAAEDVEDLQRISRPVVELDEPVGEEEGVTRGELLADEVADEVEEAADQSLTRKLVGEMLGSAGLTPKQALVLQMRYYGGDDELGLGWQAIADELEISCTGASNLHDRGLSVLRENYRKQLLDLR